ncbi:nucleotide-binding domain containing protein [Geomicrobium sp. JCM 19055]|uniref:nucleotide-binding domain containing protein n=1 Tax=Geomicrobium sp. JCM 19055 TaxID=1460649 RepID=UPI0009E04C84
MDLQPLFFSILKKEKSISGCFTSGGDFTTALCKESGANGLHLWRQIAPLTAFGSIKGGSLDGLRIMTKGGSVGDLDIIETCVTKLEIESYNEEISEV